MEQLRQDGRIPTIPTIDWVPDIGSLFGISQTEWRDAVMHGHVQEIEVNTQAGEWADILAYAEFNVHGNVLKRLGIVDLGGATTGVWMRNQTADGNGLYSGYSDHGGLSDVYDEGNPREHRRDLTAVPAVYIPLESA